MGFDLQMKNTVELRNEHESKPALITKFPGDWKLFPTLEVSQRTSFN